MFAIGQVAAGTAPASLCRLPAGQCMVSIQSDPASANTAYIGVYGGNGTVSTANGYPIPSGGSMVFARYATESAQQLGCVSSGSASLGFVITGP